MIESIGRGIPGKEDIKVTIVVVVIERADGSSILAEGGITQSRSPDFVGENAVPVIVIKAIAPEVIFHEKVELAVIVVIEPKPATPSVAIGEQACDITDISKDAVAVAVKKQIAFGSRALFRSLGNIEVEVSVVIVITEGKAVPILAIQLRRHDDLTGLA